SNRAGLENQSCQTPDPMRAARISAHQSSDTSSTASAPSSPPPLPLQPRLAVRSRPPVRRDKHTLQSAPSQIRATPGIAPVPDTSPSPPPDLSNSTTNTPPGTSIPSRS